MDEYCQEEDWNLSNLCSHSVGTTESAKIVVKADIEVHTIRNLELRVEKHTYWMGNGYFYLFTSWVPCLKFR